MTEPAPLHVAVIDQNTFFRISVAAWLPQNVSSIASVCTIPSWGAAVQHGLKNIDIVFLDTLLPGAPSVARQVRILHTAHIRTVLIAPDRSHLNPERVRSIDAHGLVFRTDPVTSLITVLENLPVVPARSFDLPPAGVSSLPRLAPHQRNVVELYGTGLTLREVAERMGLSRHTAETYLKEARARYEKAGIDIRTKTRLVMHAGLATE